VLNYQEATHHPQNQARGGMAQIGPFLHPRKAPVFQGTEVSAHAPILGLSASEDEILSELGYDERQIDAFKAKQIIGT